MHRSVPPVVLFSFLAIGALPHSWVASAQASFLGDTITCTPGFPLGSLTIGASAVVADPDVEFTLAQPGTDLFDFDFSGTTLTVTALALNGVSGSSPITFGDLDCVGDPGSVILGISLVPGSAVLSLGSFSFTADSITVDLQGGWQAGDSATITIASSCDPVAVSPSTWGMVKHTFVN